MPICPDSYARGAADERRRVASILKSQEAAGRIVLAQHLALETSMDAKAAIAALAAAPLGQSADAIAFAKGAQEARLLLGIGGHPTK